MLKKENTTRGLSAKLNGTGADINLSVCGLCRSEFLTKKNWNPQVTGHAELVWLTKNVSKSLDPCLTPGRSNETGSADNNFNS